jgi:hypothetical protein
LTWILLPKDKEIDKQNASFSDWNGRDEDHQLVREVAWNKTIAGDSFRERYTSGGTIIMS